MLTRKNLFILLCLFTLLFTACSQPAPLQETQMAMQATEPAGEVMRSETPPDEMEEETSAGITAEDHPAEAMQETEAVEVPAWFNATLHNVNTGETFTFAELKGKVVLVETMAVWCTTCLRQQQQVKALHEMLGEREDFVSVGLDIDSNEDAEILKEFVDRSGFDWVYAVVPPDVAREIGQLYGNQFLNPPSTPMLIVDRHGQAHPLPFGLKSAEELNAALEPFLTEGM